MNFLNLQYFIIVAKERNYTSAAEKLLVSQQSLSEHIKKLEAEVGTALILRKRPLELTDAGEIFYKAAEQMLDIKEQMLYDITESMTLDERQVTVAIPTYKDPPYLAGLLEYFYQKYPHITVNVKKRRDTEIQECMKNISFYFSIPPLNDHLSHSIILRNDFNCLVVRQSLLDRVFGEQWKEVEERMRETGDLTLFREVPFLLVQDRKGKLQKQASLLFEEAGFDPIVGFCSDNGNLNSAMCLQGKGAKIGTLFLQRESFREQIDRGDDPLRLFVLKTRKDSVPLVLSSQKGREISPVDNFFLTAAREYIHVINEQYKGAYGLEQYEDQFLI